MSLAFAGTASYAAGVLSGLADAGQAPALVITTPDKPKGRHGTPQPSPVKEVAGALGLAVIQPARPDDAEALARLRAARIDLIVVVAYGRILRQPFLDEFATICAHPSLLPRWRGAAPVERALMVGDAETGVTTFSVTLGVDEGPIADVRRIAIGADFDAGALHEALLAPAVDGLMATIAAIGDGSVSWSPQTGESTYAEKITAADRVVDWTRPATAIADQVRALSPHIGAVATIGGRRTLIWAARALGEPPADTGGDRLVLPAGSGLVEVLELQPESRRRMSAAEFLHGAGRALTEL
jgi:methionyl-tRNA formyltransferase